MKITGPLTGGIVFVSSLFAIDACSSSNNSSNVNGAAADGSGASNGSGAADGSGAANGSGADGSGASSGSGSVQLNLGGSASESLAGETGIPTGDSSEICDGIDNDHDGIIDNVDKNGDGVCDCLLIATLGVKGSSGQGDVFAAWLTARSDTGAADLADQTLTPELLAQYEVIVAQDVHPESRLLRCRS